MTKKSFCVKVLCIILVALVASSLCSLSSDALSLRIVDNADLLTVGEESLLIVKADAFKQQFGYDLVIVTVDSIGTKSSQAYADDYYDYNDYSSSGILLLISMETREWAISTVGECFGVFPNYVTEEIMSSIISDVSAGNYYNAFDEFIDLCSQYAETGSLETEKDAGYYFVSVLIILGVSALIALIVILIMKRSMKISGKANAANNYIVKGSFNLKDSGELFLFSNVTKTPKPKNNGNSSGGHISSSGRTHGGSHGKF